MKFDHKEIFLYDTYSRIEGVVGPDRAAQVYGELGEHIDDHQQELESKGLPSDLAQHAAIKAMGTPQQIAVEFARHSVSRPWKGAYVWVALLVLAVIFTPLDSSSRWSMAPGVTICAILLAFQAVRHGKMLPAKLLVGGAAFAILATSFVASRSIQTWGTRVPYQLGHLTLLNMRSEHEKFLALESETAADLNRLRDGLLTATLQSRVPVRIAYLDYTYNMNAIPVIVWQGRPGGFTNVPTKLSQRYPSELVADAIAEKIANMHFQQRMRRGQLTMIEAQINSPAVYRMLLSLPFTLMTTTVVFGTASFLTYSAAQFAVLRRTRRRQIWS